uniref:Uncharacterized protein n=1 Tax=Zea mays TaxID=4577 RepID=B6TW03_MAIZE|nr:hypothetical protein [Zea mays]
MQLLYERVHDGVGPNRAASSWLLTKSAQHQQDSSDPYVVGGGGVFLFLLPRTCFQSLRTIILPSCILPRTRNVTTFLAGWLAA